MEARGFRDIVEWDRMLGFNVELSGSPVLCSANSLTNVIYGSWQSNFGPVQLSKFSVDCLLWLHFLRLGTANSTANLLDDVEGNPCGKIFSPIFQAIFLHVSINSDRIFEMVLTAEHEIQGWGSTDRKSVV